MRLTFRTNRPLCLTTAVLALCAVPYPAHAAKTYSTVSAWLSTSSSVAAGLAALSGLLLILLLRERSRIRTLQAEHDRMAAAGQECDRLLKEIHHRVKNNLQAVCGILMLQRSSAARDDQGAKPDAMLDECIERIRSIACVHEVLYGGRDAGRVDMRSYVDKLLYGLAHSNGMDGRIELRTVVADLALPMETASPCGLILTELATNAFKHAFVNGEAGRLTVSLERTEGFAHLVVEDNGPGMDNTQTRSGSLGLRLVDGLVRQLRGEKRVETASGPEERPSGTRVSVTFPLPRD